MTDFTPLTSLFGGILIGLSAVMLMYSHGRIAGITGLLGGVIPPVARDWAWRLLFLVCAALAPLVLAAFGFHPAFLAPPHALEMITGGVLVGIGVYFGNGCPSGHGICGLSRFSVRSLVAVLTFMATAAITVFVTRHVMGQG